MKYLKIILLTLFFIFLFSANLTTSNDFNQDLGRHLKLGKIIVLSRHIPKTNLFSYTNPSFPFINHHWLSEAIFYFLSSSFSLISLIYLKIFLVLISTAVVINLSIHKLTIQKKLSDRMVFFETIAIALLFSPFLISRSDIRPEIFGYFLFSVVLSIILKYPKNKRLIYVLPLIMILWINLHISFIFGLFLIFLFFLKVIYLKLSDDRRQNLNQLKTELLIISLSLFALALNPNGIKGVIYPFTIFRNYGYPIVENQNIFFLNQATFNPLIKYFFILSPLTIASFFYLLISSQIIEAVILGVFFLLSIWQIRHWPFFALAAIGLIAPFLHRLSQFVGKKYKQVSTLSLGLCMIEIIITIILTILFASNLYYQTFDLNKQFGIGFNEDYKKGVLFVQKNNLPKNIFNNFDIGGYLVYKLYPKYKLFIDNRPEAYPADFLQKIYIKLEENKPLRKAVFKKKKVKTVVFAHTDQTPWGEKFIRQMADDHRWSLVYLDSSITIWTTKTSLTDVRNKPKKLLNLIKINNNYLKLLRLSRIFSLVGKNEESRLALKKAEKRNPHSCLIKRLKTFSYLNHRDFYFQRLGEEMRKKDWYCF